MDVTYSLPPETWVNIVGYLEEGKAFYDFFAVSRTFASFCFEVRKRKLKEVMKRFKVCCAGKSHGRTYFIADLRPPSRKNESKELEMKDCPRCEISVKPASTKGLFFFVPKSGKGDEMCFELLEFIRTNICKPGVYDSRAGVEAYKDRIARFLIKVFGMAWFERHRDIVKGCDWSSVNKRVKDAIALKERKGKEKEDEGGSGRENLRERLREAAEENEKKNKEEVRRRMKLIVSRRG